jgi:hypothetical protein
MLVSEPETRSLIVEEHVSSSRMVIEDEQTAQAGPGPSRSAESAGRPRG